MRLAQKRLRNGGLGTVSHGLSRCEQPQRDGRSCVLLDTATANTLVLDQESFLDPSDTLDFPGEQGMRNQHVCPGSRGRTSHIAAVHW